MKEGDVSPGSDLGTEEAVLASSRFSELARLLDRMAGEVMANGATLEELLEALDEERGNYYRQRFASS